MSTWSNVVAKLDGVNCNHRRGWRVERSTGKWSGKRQSEKQPGAAGSSDLCSGIS